MHPFFKASVQLRSCSAWAIQVPEQNGAGALHPPLMRRRENTSFSSIDSVEWKGTHVGRTALLLTLLFLNGKRC